MLASEMRPCVEQRSESKTARGVFFRDTHHPSALSISLHLTQTSRSKGSTYSSEVVIHPPARIPEFGSGVADWRSKSTSGLGILLRSIDAIFSSSTLVRVSPKRLQSLDLRRHRSAAPGRPRRREGGCGAAIAASCGRGCRSSRSTNSNTRRKKTGRSRRNSDHCHGDGRVRPLRPNAFAPNRFYIERRNRIVVERSQENNPPTDRLGLIGHSFNDHTNTKSTIKHTKHSNINNNNINHNNSTNNNNYINNIICNNNKVFNSNTSKSSNNIKNNNDCHIDTNNNINNSYSRCTSAKEAAVAVTKATAAAKTTTKRQTATSIFSNISDFLVRNSKSSSSNDNCIRSSISPSSAVLVEPVVSVINAFSAATASPERKLESARLGRTFRWLARKQPAGRRRNTILLRIHRTTTITTSRGATRCHFCSASMTLSGASTCPLTMEWTNSTENILL